MRQDLKEWEYRLKCHELALQIRREVAWETHEEVDLYDDFQVFESRIWY